MHTILIVDDDKITSSMLGRTLRNEKRIVLTAGSAEEGLTILEQNEVHLVISDFKMPGMNGGEFLGKVRDKYPETARFMVTGTSGVRSDLEKAKPGLVQKHFSKPVDVGAMRAAVGEVLEGHLSQY